MTATIAVFQPYVANYRVPFFDHLQERLRSCGVVLQVLAGRPFGDQALRGDAADLPPYAKAISSREFGVAGRRIVLREIPASARAADLVVVEQARRNVDTYQLFLPQGLRLMKHVALWGHGPDQVVDSPPFDRRVSLALLRRSDHFFGYTTQSVQWAIANGYPENKCSVVRNSIDVGSLSSEIDGLSDEDIRDYRTRFDLQGRTALVLGGLDAEKRIVEVLSVAEQVAQRVPGFRMLIAGNGRLKSLVEDFCQRRPWSHYLGPVHSTDKALALSCSDVIFNPGRVGLVAVDSIVSGKPILTTSSWRHAPEFGYLTPGDSVILVENSEVGFVAGLVGTLGDGALLKSHSEQLRSQLPGFSVEAMADNFAEGCLTALAKR